MAIVLVAIRTFVSISSDEWSDRPLQLAARAIAPGSRETYLSALRQFAKHSKPTDTLEEALNNKMCAIARHKRVGQLQQDECQPLDSWKNSNSCPPLSSSSTSSKWKPLRKSQPRMHPSGVTEQRSTSNTWEGPESTGHGPACSSSRLAQLSSECVAGIRRASRGHGLKLQTGPSVSTKNEEKSGSSTHCPLSWKSGRVASPSSNNRAPPPCPRFPWGGNALRNIQKECMQHCPLGATHVAPMRTHGGSRIPGLGGD